MTVEEQQLDLLTRITKVIRDNTPEGTDAALFDDLTFLTLTLRSLEPELLEAGVVVKIEDGLLYMKEVTPQKRISLWVEQR